MGINQFSIYTDLEFQEKILGTQIGQNIVSSNVDINDQTIKSVIIDWNDKGAVGPVRN